MGTANVRPSVMLVITKGELGGAQTHLLTLCGALAGRASLLVAIGGPGAESSPLARDLARLGIPVRSVPSLRNSLSPWQVAKATRDLLRVVREVRPDALHAHSAVAGVVTRLAGWLTRIPVIYTVHGFGFKPEAPPVQRALAFAAEWLLAPLTHHMICVSRHEQALARRLPIEVSRTTVVQNALADSAPRALASIQPMRIAMVARFAAPKRPELLVGAAALLRDRLGQEFAVALIGDGPDLGACQDLAQQLELRRIEFVGSVSDVPQRLADHQVFVLASDHEGLPISVLEAMRAGMAIVASDLPGIRELVGPGEEALLVPNDAHAIAEALARIATSRELAASLAAAARRRYERLFTPEKMAESVLALYGQIAVHEPQCSSQI